MNSLIKTALLTPSAWSIRLSCLLLSNAANKLDLCILRKLSIFLGNVLNSSLSSSLTLNTMNKVSSSYFFVSSSFDFSSLFTSFSESKQERWMLLLEKWCTVMSMNKYNVGLTDVD